MACIVNQHEKCPPRRAFLRQVAAYCLAASAFLAAALALRASALALRAAAFSSFSFLAAAAFSAFASAGLTAGAAAAGAATGAGATAGAATGAAAVAAALTVAAGAAGAAVWAKAPPATSPATKTARSLFIRVPQKRFLLPVLPDIGRHFHNECSSVRVDRVLKIIRTRILSQSCSVFAVNRRGCVFHSERRAFQHVPAHSSSH